MDPLTVILSRIQMAFTLSFHIIFPSLNIGLALFIFVLEAMWLKTKNPVFLKLCKFWCKIFALAFGMGVVSGVVMSYELGTNFGNFTNAIGEVLGSLFVYEVLSAFFLEAGFLGILLFGWDRVSPRMHFVANFMMMFGTALSAMWIMAANSWMQTPAGFHLEDGKFLVDTWMGVIFNPSFVPRFIHMLMASYVTASFFIAGVSAWYLLKGRHLELAKKGFSYALGAAVVLVPLQIFVGDTVGLEVHQNQPIKTAAIEGVWQTQKGAPLLLFAIPDPDAEKNLFAVKIPHGAALINTHKLDGELVGLDSVPKEDRPLVFPTFFGFRIMVGVALVFLFLAWYSLWLRKKGRLYDTRWFNWACVFATPLGFIGTVSGWFTAETGRQPWVVYNLMRTAEGASDVPALHVGISLALIVTIYTSVFCFFLYYLFKSIRKGPEELEKAHEQEHHAFQYMTRGE
ncbi:MAG: cytochrome ubiquinol oxidase subunit I [Legionellales bacterium]|nr:cytochrome ubiquinol oxidase subunit I [Legionellales bacterium]